MNKISLLILAGGMGSRYKNQKQVDAISSDGTTLMEFALYDAIKTGIRKFVFIVNDQFPADYRLKISKLLSVRNCTSHFIEQTLNKFIPKGSLYKLENRVKPLGTAHAVLCAKEMINEAFLTMNADDYYGFETFQKAVKYIQEGNISSTNFAMCAFELNNTLSKNGSVSRGICQISEGKLLKVEEFTQIEEKEGEIQGLNEALEEQKLLGKEEVSMNFWILHPSFFKMAEKELQLFLKKHTDFSNVEFYLPSVVDKAIQQKEIDVEVLSTRENWFGLTYPNDKEIVVREIEQMKENGKYPHELWMENKHIKLH